MGFLYLPEKYKNLINSVRHNNAILFINIKVSIYLNVIYINSKQIMEGYNMRDFFLTTERLYFSVWDENDLLDAIKLWGNPEVTKFIAADGKMTKEQICQRFNKEIEMYKNYNIQYWPIFIKDTYQIIGCCRLRPYDYKNKILEMGVHLKQEYWGCGYAKEACSAVIDYAFDTLQVNALFAGHNPKNLASAKLLKKLGFIYTHDEFYPPTGLYHPSYLMTKQDRIGA